jgi:F-type H+-transporting ATPase subunit alpha
MKQKQYTPLPVAKMAVSLFAVDRGYLDDVEESKISDFEAALHGYMDGNCADLMAKIDETGDWNDELEAAFKKAVEDFKNSESY